MPIPTKRNISEVPGKPKILGVFSPAYFASSALYRAMAGCDIAVTDTSLRADKRFKSAHRCAISDKGGVALLTCAVSRFSPGVPWSEVMLSSHGQWWEKHLSTLATIYGPTPFFSHYIPMFAPVLRRAASIASMSVTDLDMALDARLRHVLGLAPHPAPSVTASALNALNDTGLALIAGKTYSVVDYRNVKFDIPEEGLSVLDLIFKHGPEAAAIIRQRPQP